jgi:cytochrome P450
MSLHPEVQVKARSEIDQKIGTNRLPNYKDRESLPYLNALVKELLRWNPATPLGKG